MKTLVVGDVHGEWQKLNALLEYALRVIPDIEQIVQVGDFGFWPRVDPVWHNWTGLPFGFIDGNHEDFDVLWSDEGQNILELHNLIYLPRFTVRDDALFLGGATSIDKAERVQGGAKYGYFPQEDISYGEAMRFVGMHGHDLDIIIAHDVPAQLYLGVTDYGSKGLGLGNSWDSNAKILQELYEVYKPFNYICGHHHQRKTILYKYGRVDVLSSLHWYTDTSEMLNQCCLVTDLPDIEG